ncbi:redoxin domain-containing protein [Flavobacterium sp. CYK-4]|uniref:TlpA family protein disulfide reductase n=1 Tax=Flavobacterium lotistagni TaxID=2709660 RepID=UPI00140AF922|nr:thioredoxin-like domain-containing protein [Flavobacterium lotistagni]NHM08216.1 redoxin domain-containing protein [Flavobacterium lotistagni]
MFSNKLHQLFLLASSAAALFCSCNKPFKSDNYTAYFGGEVMNPTNPYVLFCKDNEVIDSVKIDEKNRFFIKFDSLAPGLYTFKNEPEYQSVYFDKNDSIMVRINAKDFDNSIIFCGRGDQKNNFLMEMYMKNEEDRSQIFDVFDYNVKDFVKNIDSAYAAKEKFYQTKKEAIKWSDDFDVYAKAALNFHHYIKKEIYPMAHQMRTGEDILEKLPKDYYDYRKEVNYNDEKLSSYAPFVSYLSHMLNNVATIHYHNHFTPVDLALKENISKLNIADSLIKNKTVKNAILNNIAFTYLLEDQNMVNNQIFLETYHKYSTDKSKKNEILKIGNAIQMLKVGNALPKVELVNAEDRLISSNNFTPKKTVIFFWTDNLSSHMMAAHKKIQALKAKYPAYQFIGINLDKDQTVWKSQLKKLNTPGITELRCTNFEDLKANWAIMKVHRTIVLDSNGKIKNAFTSLFDVNFEKEL